jgi:hypothetical protein
MSLVLAPLQSEAPKAVTADSHTFPISGWIAIGCGLWLVGSKKYSLTFSWFFFSLQRFESDSLRDRRVVTDSAIVEIVVKLCKMIVKVFQILVKVSITLSQRLITGCLPQSCRGNRGIVFCLASFFGSCASLCASQCGEIFGSCCKGIWDGLGEFCFGCKSCLSSTFRCPSCGSGKVRFYISFLTSVSELGYWVVFKVQ